MLKRLFLMPPTKVDKRHIKHGYLDKNPGFIKLDRLLSVTPFFTILFVVIFCGSQSITRAQTPSIPSTHPRVYLSQSDVGDLRAKVKLAEFEFSWKRVSNSSNPAAMALVYLITEDKSKGRQAVEQALSDLKALKGSMTAKRWYTPVHIGACVYDWCYDLLTDEQKREFVAEFERLAASSSYFGYPASRVSVGTGANEGCLLSGQLPVGLAIYDEQPKMFDAAAKLFFSSIKPVRDYYYPAHTHHQGGDYINRLMYDMFASWLFRAIGAGNVLSTEQQYLPYAMLYNRRPDWRQMRRSDTWDYTGHAGSKRFLAMLVGTYYNDPYLMQFVDEPIWASMSPQSTFSPDGKEYWSWGWGTDFAEVFHLIFREPQTPKAEISQLPLTKYFAEPMGEMVMRTGWDMWTDERPSNDAMIFMRLGGTFFTGHQHRDMGTFQIYYKGPLATVSGVYQGPDSHTETGDWSPQSTAHRANYLHQTLSHNGLLIFDPEEDLGDNQYRSINDGGQIMPNKGASPTHNNLETLYKLAEVTSRAFGTDTKTPDYSYISGNITKAYSSKVRLVTRSMAAINLKNDKYPAALITFDRIESANPEFKKTWLLHSHQKPAINVDTITIINNGQFNMYNGQWSQQNWSGKLVAQSLLPRSSDIVAVGGKGKEFWIPGEQRNLPILWNENDEPGAWRVEVSPTIKQKRDVFLHVMTVMDEDEAVSPKVELIENEQIAGAVVLDRAVILGKSEKMLDEVTFTLDGGVIKILVCDLSAGNWEVRCDDRVIVKKQVKDKENVLYFTVDSDNNTEYQLNRKF
jgi:hypothetical protein